MKTQHTTRAQKIPAKRAFSGIAGSPLAKAMEQRSDHTLRVTKSPDRTDPLAFESWIDAFSQKHGQIDLDNAFQEYAFDRQIGPGENPIESKSVPSHAEAIRPNDYSPTQDLGLPAGAKVTTGMLPGDRPIGRRRPDKKSWWVFDGKLLREFLRPLYNSKRMERCEKAIFVLHFYYLQNRTDNEIFDERSFFRDVRSVKEYRRALINKGAEQFKDQKPESTWHGRRGVWQGSGLGYDFSGRRE